MTADLKSLVKRFDPVTRQAVEGAAGLRLSRTHYEIEIEHFLTKVFEVEGSDCVHIAEHFNLDRARMGDDLRAGLNHLNAGNTRGPVFSPPLIKMFTEGWSIAALNFGASNLRTGHALLALLSEDTLARIVRELSKQLRKILLDVLLSEFTSITARSAKASVDKATVSSPEGEAHEPSVRTGFLAQYSINLTAEARAGRVHAVIGRDAEIRQMIDVLMRRRQNNLILAGEAGVHKTAVVEGLAGRTADGEVPEALANVRLHTLDLALLQAGAGVKGEHNRLKGLVQEVKASPQPVILFIDEAHTMIGAGGQQGQADAINIIKPALARGELRTIAATTWAEYKRYFENDAALARRFQVIKIDEPSEPLCEAMLRSIRPSLEGHHQARILDEAISAAVRLTHRYLPGRQVPDKAVSVLDTACACVALSRHARPEALQALARCLALWEAEKRVLVRKQVTGASHVERIAEGDEQIRLVAEERQGLEQHWSEEAELVRGMQALHIAIEAGSPSANAAHNLGALTTLRAQLRTLQASVPPTHLAVDAQLVAAVVSEWTGIPLGKMIADEIAKLLRLKADLEERVIGQDHALAAIAQRVWTSRANMDDPGKPIGVFLLAGRSGVGKTETAWPLPTCCMAASRT